MQIKETICIKWLSLFFLGVRGGGGGCWGNKKKNIIIVAEFAQSVVKVESCWILHVLYLSIVKIVW